jgi:hypothetical protein
VSGGGRKRKDEPAEQFGKLYWDVQASLAVRAVLARVEYRCYTADGFKPTEIIEADFELALGLGRTATKSAIQEALDLKLITRTRSVRGDGRGVFVYAPLPRPDSDPDQVAKRPRRCRQRAVTRSPNDPDGVANVQSPGRQTDLSDPAQEPIEPKTEPGVDPATASQAPEPMGRHRDIAAEAAERAATKAANLAKMRRLAPEAEAAVAEAPWLTGVTRELRYFALLGDQNERWRTGVEKTMDALGWTQDVVVMILRGCQREHDDLLRAGELAEAIAKGTFPKATHLFSRGFEEPWIHRVDKISWAEWGYLRWAAPAKAEPQRRDPFREQAELRRRLAAQREADIAAIEAKGDAL